MPFSLKFIPPTPTPTPTPTISPTPTPTPTLTPTPTPTITPTPTPNPCAFVGQDCKANNSVDACNCVNGLTDSYYNESLDLLYTDDNCTNLFTGYRSDGNIVEYRINGVFQSIENC